MTHLQMVAGWDILLVQKTVEKVMACHQEATDAKFLIKDGHKITKLLMQYVERLTA